MKIIIRQTDITFCKYSNSIQYKFIIKQKFRYVDKNIIKHFN